MTNTLFDFTDPTIMLRRHVVESNKSVATNRVSGTIQNTVRHGVIHTMEPSATLHHHVIAASPHPTKNRADAGEFYMIAYVSIPMEWSAAIDNEFAQLWDISFLGPIGMIQKLPPALADVEDLLGERVYVGFDWLWLGGGEKPAQPSHDWIKNQLIKFANELRRRVDPDWIPAT